MYWPAAAEAAAGNAAYARTLSVPRRLAAIRGDIRCAAQNACADSSQPERDDGSRRDESLRPRSCCALSRPGLGGCRPTQGSSERRRPRASIPIGQYGRDMPRARRVVPIGVIAHRTNRRLTNGAGGSKLPEVRASTVWRYAASRAASAEICWSAYYEPDNREIERDQATLAHHLC